MIPSDELRLLIRDTVLSLSRGSPVIQSTYQIVTSDAVIAETVFDAKISRFDQFEKADTATFTHALSWFSSIKEWHRPQSELNGYSYHDASLILKSWAFSKPGNLWTILHPVSGVFSGLKVPVKEGRPTLRGRILAITGNVPPPPAWSTVSSSSIEEIEVQCVEVDGADFYNVYTEVGSGQYTLLGSVPDHTANTLSVPGGYYRIRIAPVQSGEIGVMGNETQVQVEGAGTPAAAPEMDETPLFVEESIPEKRNKLLEWLRGFKRDKGNN